MLESASSMQKLVKPVFKFQDSNTGQKCTHIVQYQGDKNNLITNIGKVLKCG